MKITMLGWQKIYRSLNLNQSIYVNLSQYVTQVACVFMYHVMEVNKQICCVLTLVTYLANVFTSLSSSNWNMKPLAGQSMSS